MRRIIVTLTVVTVGTLGVWSLPAGAQGDIHVFSPAGSIRARFSDLGRPGLRLGDRLTARGPLFDASEAVPVGTAHLDCVVMRHITDGPDGPGGMYRCSYVLRLADGSIVLEGLDPHGPGVYAFAVIGGTGAYASATGEATLTDTFEGTDFAIDLSG